MLSSFSISGTAKYECICYIPEGLESTLNILTGLERSSLQFLCIPRLLGSAFTGFGAL